MKATSLRYQKLWIGAMTAVLFISTLVYCHLTTPGCITVSSANSAPAGSLDRLADRQIVYVEAFDVRFAYESRQYVIPWPEDVKYTTQATPKHSIRIVKTKDGYWANALTLKGIKSLPRRTSLSPNFLRLQDLKTVSACWQSNTSAR